MTAQRDERIRREIACIHALGEDDGQPLRQFIRRQAMRVITAQMHAACQRTLHPDQGAQECGLTRAVGADEAGQFTGTQDDSDGVGHDFRRLARGRVADREVERSKRHIFLTPAPHSASPGTIVPLREGSQAANETLRWRRITHTMTGTPKSDITTFSGRTM